MTIFLLGFMGSGKTTIGTLLAKRLNWQFTDLDHYIEEQEGSTVSLIFEQKGEGYFRALETRYLEELAGKEGNRVISLGGGTPCFNGNMETASKMGTTVYLKTSPDELLSRLIHQTANRPLLKDKSPEQLRAFITEKLDEREPFYNKAQLTFLTDGGRGADELLQVLEPLL